MTKWEYANIRTFRSWDKKAKQFTKWQVFYTSNRSNVPLIEGLREMGAMGWELVTALPTSILSASTGGRDGGAQVEVHETVLLFKRPIEEKSPVETAGAAAADSEAGSATSDERVDAGGS